MLRSRLCSVVTPVLFLSVALATACLVAQEPVVLPATAVVRRVLDAQVAAWNRGDLEGFMAGYWKSPQLTFFSGSERTTGWTETLERYRKRYQAGGKMMGTLAFRELDVVLFGTEQGVARGRWQLQIGTETHSGLFTLILRKLPDGWKIVHDHTSGS